MKRLAYLFATLALISFNSCKKSGTSPSKPKGSTSATVMYPATVIISQNGVSGTFQYTYDSNNNLIKYGQDGAYVIDITPHTVTQTSFTYYEPGGGVKTLTGEVINTYAYSSGSNTPVDIYTNVPGQLTITTVNKDITNDKSTSYGNGLWLYGAGKDNTIIQMGNSDNGGQTINFVYDDNDNLKTVSYINLSGPQAGKVISTITVTALDNKPSPCSAIKGYNVVSYPQYYAPDFALAFCKNNPTQIVLKQFDYNTATLVADEQDDFTYTYNAQGYPTTVTVNISYLGIGASHSTKSYTYTYK